MISFIWSIFSVILETLEALGLDDKLKSLAYIIPNFMVRTLIIILILSFLNISWTLAFLAIVLGINSLFLLKAGSSCQSSKCPEVFKRALTQLSSYCSLPPHKNRVASLLVSLPLPLLVSEDVTLKEIGVVESEEDRKQSERSLSLFSITNLMVFLPVSYIPVYMITSGHLQFDQNVIISPDQLQQIYLYIVLPLAGLALLASLLVLFSPVLTNDKLKKILFILVTAASVILPITVGMTMIEKSPSSLLIFVQREDCVQIYPGITKVDQDFDIEELWSLSADGGSIINERREMFELRNSSGVSSSNRSLQIIFKNNNNTFKWIAPNNKIKIEKTNFISKDMLDR